MVSECHREPTGRNMHIPYIAKLMPSGYGFTQLRISSVARQQLLLAKLITRFRNLAKPVAVNILTATLAVISALTFSPKADAEILAEKYCSIKFAYLSVGLSPAQQHQLSACLSALQSDLQPSKQFIEILGYTQNNQSNSANVALALKRANTVLRYFLAKGLPAKHADAVAVFDNSGQQDHNKRRRVEIWLMSKDPHKTAP